MDTHTTAMRSWVENFIVGLGICPFAAAVTHDGIHYQVCPAKTLEELLPVAQIALTSLLEESTPTLTTLLMLPEFSDFETYLDGLNLINGLVIDLEFEGQIQVASFHPEYLFEGEDPSDVSHWTNRSPVPTYHLIREDDVSRGVANHPDPEGIPARNIALLRKLGVAEVRRLAGFPPHPL